MDVTVQRHEVALTPAHVVKALDEAGEDLPPEFKRQILDLGQDAIPALVVILEADIEEQMESWAPVHAVELLGELKATIAIETMLRLLAASDPFDAVHDQLILVLGKMGAPVLEPALRAYADTTDAEVRSSLCSILADLRIRDERVLAALLDLLRVDPTQGACDLAVYGDPQAIPHLAAAFDAFELEEDPKLLGNQALIEIRAALADLGGSLTEGQWAKYERAIALRKQWQPPLDADSEEDDEQEDPEALVEPVLSRGEKLGRNDPCWCGSGIKFKKCHLD